MTDQTMTPEQALTRAQTLVGKLRGKHVAGSLSLDEQMELGLCWQTLRAALSRPVVPEGWKLVPVEPTQGMLDATSWPGCAKTDYKHMLAAAPEPAGESLTGEQPEDGSVAGYAAVYEGRICHEFFNATPEGLRADTVAAGYDAPEAIVALYPQISEGRARAAKNLAVTLFESIKQERDALRERVRELEADARRWHFVRQFMCLDDVGDEDFCLGLIIYGESLSERVDPAASRLYKDRWDERCRAEYQGEELDQGEITVDEAIDAAMQEGD